MLLGNLRRAVTRLPNVRGKHRFLLFLDNLLGPGTFFPL